jgi:hypothetical protein
MQEALDVTEEREAMARCVAFVNLEVFTVVPAEERSPPTI